MSSLRSPLVGLLLAALALPAGAHATLSVTHQGTAAAEQPASDGLIGPGDTIGLTESLLSSAPSLTGIFGRLTTTTPGVTITRSGSSFPDVTEGSTTANTLPFTAVLAPAFECGQDLVFNLDLGADQGQQDIPITVGTGAAGPLERSDSPDVPRTLEADSTVSSTLVVPAAGRIKDLRVDLGRINHADDGNLRVWIEAPDHTAVTLVDQRGGTGDDFVDSVFSTAGPSVVTAAAPFTGTYAAEGDLGTLVGHQIQGTWTLHIADFGTGGPGTLLTHRDRAATLGDGGTADGTLAAWGLRLAAASCGGAPLPSFTATPNPIVPGGTVTLDGSASVDPNGSIADYAWDLDGDGSFETDTATTPTTTHVYPTKGSVPVGLRITDNQGNQATTTVALAVTSPPVASFSYAPVIPVAGDSVTLDGSGSSDPDGSIVSYAWDLDGNGTFEHDTAAAANTAVSFGHAGSHTVRLRVTDDTGAVAIRTLDIFVVDHAPTATLTAPATITAGTPATFSGAGSSDPDGTIVRYEWELDDSGTWTDTGSTAIHDVTWSTPGSHLIRLRVSDDAGLTDTATLTVPVTAPISAPSGVGPGSDPASPDAGAGGSTPSEPALSPFSAGLVGASVQALRLARRHGITLACRVAARARCTLTARLSARDVRRLGIARGARAPKIVGRAVVVAVPGRDTRVLMALSAPLRRALRRVHRVRLMVRGRAVDDAGRSVALSRAILLRD